MSDKVFTVFAGVNGAGKSSLYYSKGEDFGTRINLDEIIKEQFDHDWKSSIVQMKAGKIAIKLIKDCIAGDSSFNQETTLTGGTVIKNIKTAKQNGFKVHLYYVGLESAELSIARVAHRVLMGGHGIDEDVLRRRYSRSFENLRLVIPFCDVVKIYDNSQDKPDGGMTLQMVIVDGVIIYRHKNMPKYLNNSLNP